MTDLTDYSDQDVIIRAIPGIALRFNSNEYTDHLTGRIATCIETEKNYTIAINNAQYYTQRVDLTNQFAQCVAHRIKLEELKSFIEDAMASRNPDLSNNVGRSCNIPGDTEPRQWTVVFAMQRDSKGWPQYLVRHRYDADTFQIVPMLKMTNLY